MAANTENNEAANSRSIVDFKVSYSFGNIHTTGRKKGQLETKGETITIIVFSIDRSEINQHLQEYCGKKNMQLLTSGVDGVLVAPSPFEFDRKYKNCGERSFNMDPDPERRKFCSRYCKEKAEGIF